MLRPILRTKILRRPITSYVRYSISSNSNEKFDKDKRRSRFSLKKPSNDFFNLDYESLKDKSFNDNSVNNNLYKCKNIDQILDLIEPNVNKLTGNQLTIIYSILYKPIIHFKAGKQKFLYSLRQSSVLRSLLDHTSQFTRQLETENLAILVRLFHLIDQDPRSQIVDSTW